MTATPPAEAEAHHALVTDPRRQRQILVAMCAALVAVVASVSGLNVAQQDLALDLQASQNDLLWIINGYTMALAALLLPVGAIGDRWGRKPVLLAGLGLFATANLMGGMADSTTILLAARVLAGVAAAMIMPVTLSVITSSFPPDERAKAIGIWAGFAGAGGIIGLFVSSFIVDYLTWPWLFAMPAVLAVTSFVLTVPAVDDSKEVHEGRFDAVGSIVSAVAIGGLVLGIHEGPERGWGDPLTMLGMTAGLLGLAAFVVWELRQDQPLLDVRLFSHRGLAAGSLTLLVVFAVMFGVFLVLPQFTQAVLGYSALKAATAMLPMVLVMMPLSAAAPVLASRIGFRTILSIGVGLFALGLALLALLVSAEGGYMSVLPGLLVLSVGIGLCMSPATTIITESLPVTKQGVASALNDTVRELGGAIGIALLGSVVSAGYRSSVSDATVGLSAELAHEVEEGIGAAFGAAPALGGDAPRILQAAQSALVDGWQLSMWFGVGVAAATLGYLVLRGPRQGDIAAEDVLDADLPAGEALL
ncbi:DHA2 family efflux MFS transporter permease subunit [Actinomarinicola tropica]|uniref:DHA2 family efflux MFS transporter permease subunit n=1 Tax=Actinomarinicola tropica TaxID=2789776 RepID=A0A5Q2RJP2_9ACTN|nr:DHA2 family efflux MFS transporter permease subunit [Actinomarinicola tropica]QGG94257.1 DHA2 family efflux MFS transporter permease subunit [Actinomarinicola tropica]